MLVLMRVCGDDKYDPDAAVMIGDDICVRVLEVRGNKVRLGFDAPKHIAIHRMEVWQEIRAARQPQTADEIRREVAARG